MSLDNLDIEMRTGQFGCVCPSDRAGDNSAALAIGFGLAVLAQALVLTVLPEQSRLLAPTAAGVGWPFALLLIGAAVASFPAAMLIDAFGRRAAFGLGASLGAAGAAVGLFAMSHGHFGLLCLAGFWLGLAQGFSFFYRHVAARGARGSLTVLAGGAGAALVTPLIVWLTPSPGMMLGTAALLHVTALALAVRQPNMITTAAPKAAQALNGRFYLATGAAAFAWFVMAAAMLQGPLTLAICSAAPAFIGGAMGWHLFAMYGPAALAARWPYFCSPFCALSVGVVGLLVGASAVVAAASSTSVAAGLVVIGVGWSIVNVASLRLLHEAAPPSRAALAFHDLCALGAAAAGALTVATL